MRALDAHTTLSAALLLTCTTTLKVANPNPNRTQQGAHQPVVLLVPPHAGEHKPRETKGATDGGVKHHTQTVSTPYVVNICVFPCPLSVEPDCDIPYPVFCLVVLLCGPAFGCPLLQVKATMDELKRSPEAVVQLKLQAASAAVLPGSMQVSQDTESQINYSMRDIADTLHVFSELYGFIYTITHSTHI
jgi:hypothetical protein